MKKSKKITTLFLVLGILFISLSAGYVVYTEISKDQARDNMADILSQLDSLIPEPHNALPSDREDATMPILNIAEKDYFAVLEFPRYGKRLPVAYGWDKGEISKTPCRYSGSIYDKSLIIGCTDAKGQFDFSEEATVNDTLYLTDVTGGRFSFTVTHIEITKDVSHDALSKREADLLIFIRNTMTLDYTLISCKMK